MSLRMDVQNLLKKEWVSTSKESQEYERLEILQTLKSNSKRSNHNLLRPKKTIPEEKKEVLPKTRIGCLEEVKLDSTRT